MKLFSGSRRRRVLPWRRISHPVQCPATVFQLDNGLTLVHQWLPTTPVVIVDVWVRAGAIAEPAAWSGMAHFLEHMIFKGTERLAPGAFDGLIENQGVMTNAATSHDYAHYFMTLAAPQLEAALPPLAELLLHAAIPDAEFDREREVVLEEIRQTQDNPDWQVYQTLVSSVYQCHPYGRSVLGTPTQLQQQSPAQMRAFHRAHYRPQNMTVVIVGGVDQDRVLDLVSRTFTDFPGTAICPAPGSTVEPPLTEIRRQTLTLPHLEQSRLMLAWLGPGVDQLRHAYGLELLAAMLTEGRTSRLVQELREEGGWVQHISSSFTLQRDSGLFVLAAWLEAEHLEAVEEILCDRLTDLWSQPITEAELTRCQRLLCNDYAFSTEAPGQLAGLYGYFATIDQAENAVLYPEIIRQLTISELQSLASQYLSPYYYAVTTLQPESTTHH